MFENQVVSIATDYNPYGWKPTHGLPNETSIANLRRKARTLDRKGLPFLVSADHCQHTIFLSENGNHASRVWHDRIHCLLRASFDYESEKAVAWRQYKQLVQGGAGAITLAIQVADSFGQSLHHQKFDCFPDPQMDFVSMIVAVAQRDSSRVRWLASNISLFEVVEKAVRGMEKPVL